MHTHDDKTSRNKSQPSAHEAPQKLSGNETVLQGVDNRPEAIAQRKLQEVANNSPQVKQLKAMQEMANNYVQMKSEANDLIGLKSEMGGIKTDAVAQRVLIVNKVEYGSNKYESFLETHNEATRAHILTALASEGYETDDIKNAVNDDRRLHVNFTDREDAESYNAEHVERPRYKKGISGLTVEATGRAALIIRPMRGHQPEEITISGMLDCIGIIIEAFEDAEGEDKGKIDGATGCHFVSGMNITEGRLNEAGLDVLGEQIAIMKRHGGPLRATVMWAQPFGGGHPAPSSASGQGLAAATLISEYISGQGVQEVRVSKGVGSRVYKLNADGTSEFS